TLAQQLNVAEKYESKMSSDDTRTEGDKFEVGLKPVASVGFDNSAKSSNSQSHTWTYGGVAAQRVEDMLSSNPVPIVLDDFHHMDAEVRTAIARAIKPLLRKTFVVLVAIPSHSFDPAKTISDLGGRVTHFEIPDWTEDELRTIAERGFEQLNLVDPEGHFARTLAGASFGSPHIMQELCYTTLHNGLGICETVEP